MRTRWIAAMLVLALVVVVAEAIVILAAPVEAEGGSGPLVLTSTSGKVRWIGTRDIKPGSYPGTLIVEEEGYAECVCPTPLAGCVCRIVDVKPKPKKS